MTPDTTESRRRPIRARESAWARRGTDLLVRSGLSPNAISASCVLWAVLGCALLVGSAHLSSHLGTAVCLLGAAACMQLRLLANLFDGMVALTRGGPRHPLGELWNEMPDRAADALFLVGAGYALGGVPTLGWLAALGAALTAYVRAQGAAAGARHHFCGPMAKQHRMALLTLASIVAAALPPSLHATAAERSPLGSVFGVSLALIALGCIVTIARRIRRIALDLRAAEGST